MDIPTSVSPPPVLRLAGHPLRWRLLAELARSDRHVRELVGLLGARQSLVSYHLGRLRAEGLVSGRRSLADGRDAYYTANLPRYGELLAEAGAALHPALRLVPADAAPQPDAVRVLFLCTGNSARSQMAEALLQDLTAGKVFAASAGSHPTRLHPNAVRAMRERGIDIAGRQAKHLRTFAGECFDHVITLCDRVREVCPEFPGHPEAIHWSIPDPSRVAGTDEETYPTFREIADELAVRIRFFIRRIRPAARIGREVG